MKIQLGFLVLACGCWLAAPLAAQEGADLFAKLDANKDGLVASDEVPEEQKALFERLVRKGDKNSDQKLSAEEFQAGLRPEEATRQPVGDGAGPRPGRPDRPNPEMFFNRLDANKDGKLTRDELGDSPGGGAFLIRVLERAGGESLSREQVLRAMANMEPGTGRPGNPDRRPGDLERRPGGNSPPGGEGDRRPEARGMPGAPPGPPRGFLAMLDTNQDGELSLEEIVASPQALLKLDKNGDNKLSREELFVGPPPGPPGGPDRGRPGDSRPGDAAKGRPGFGPEAFREQLARADKDGDGKLSKEEAPERLKENFDRIDANGDGYLDEAERRQMFQRIFPNRD